MTQTKIFFLILLFFIQQLFMVATSDEKQKIAALLKQLHAKHYAEKNVAYHTIAKGFLGTAGLVITTKAAQGLFCQSSRSTLKKYIAKEYQQKVTWGIIGSFFLGISYYSLSNYYKGLKQLLRPDNPNSIEVVQQWLQKETD